MDICHGSYGVTLSPPPLSPPVTVPLRRSYLSLRQMFTTTTGNVKGGTGGGGTGSGEIHTLDTTTNAKWSGFPVNSSQTVVKPYGGSAGESKKATVTTTNTKGFNLRALFSRNGAISSAVSTKYAEYTKNRRSPPLRWVCQNLANPTGTDGEVHGCENDSEVFFKRHAFRLDIRPLGGEEFELVLPCAPPAVVEDSEQEAEAATYEKFISMLPESCRDVSRRACPLGLVPRLFSPGCGVNEGARFVASCFWMWLCVVDDLTENLVGKEWDKAESEMIHAFSDTPPTPLSHPRARPGPPPSDITLVSLALRSIIDTTPLPSTSTFTLTSPPWRHEFRSAVREVLAGFKAERPLLARHRRRGKNIPLQEWMRVRMVTISVRPFMILARASLGLDPKLSPLGNPLGEGYCSLAAERRNNNHKGDALEKVECLIQLITGLQNDILGWEKDFRTENPLNTIQILAGGGVKVVDAVGQVVDMHNELVRGVASCSEKVWDGTFERGAWQVEGIHHVQQPVLLGVPASHVRFSLLSRCSTSSWGSGGGFGEADYHRDSLLSTRRPDMGEGVRRYLELVVGFSAGMADWMVASRRYI